MKRLIYFIIGRCDQIAELQSQALDGKLSISQRVRKGFHLLMCPPCRILKTQMKSISSLMRHLPEEGHDGLPQCGLDPKARDRIREAMAKDRVQDSLEG